MSFRTIESGHDIAEGVAALTSACPHMRAVFAVAGAPPLRRRENGFPGLARIIVGQQLSVASAGAIWGRLEKTVQPLDATVFLRKRQATLRRCGLSASKIATIQNIARAIDSGTLDLQRLAVAGESEIKQALTALKGVGPWTADIYIMFCLGRADGWAPGDLALRYAVAEATQREGVPDAAQMEEIAEAWRPWRGVAARALWSYYGIIRTSKSADPL